MFCPRCGSTQNDELKFCKSCGANLGTVRQALEVGEAPGKFDWSKTWIAEMLQSSEESLRKEKELERLQGITPEVKRAAEIKAGVITASVGVGAMIFLYIFMQGVILGGDIKPGVEQILSRIWIAGIIPIFVGLALIINGAVISKMFLNAGRTPAGETLKELADKPANDYLPPADTSQLFPAGFSVTDETTQHLEESVERRSKTN